MRRAFVILAVVGSLLTSAYLLHTEDPPRSPQPTPANAPEGELRRRAMFGAQLAPVTKDVRDRQKLDGDGGVVLEQVFPGTAAAEAEFKAGDVILAVGGARLTGIPLFLEKIAEARAGDVLTLDVVRDGVRGNKRVTLKEMPHEKGDGYDVIYGAVASRGARLRTIVTRPKGGGRHPAVMLLQGGHTCFSIDDPFGEPSGFTRIARDLAGHGYVTLRVERPGCGDSEGGPLRDVDFDTELEGYKEALRALKRLDFVDADSVFLFGHSMGGIMAPLMAVEVPVRGIAVYGTASGTWFESVFGQRRRLASLDGTNPAEVDYEILGQARFWYPLLVEKKTPREIHEQNPDLPKRVYEQWVTDDKYVGGRHYAYHHQIAAKNLSEAWTKVAVTRLSVEENVPKAPAGPLHPRVLAIWGTSDWLSTRSQATWIAEVVNRVKPGSGTFVALDSIDHFFFRAASTEESYRLFKPAKGAPPREFNPVILETLRAWLDETAAREKKGVKKDEADKLDAFIRQGMHDWSLTGLAVAVVKDDKVVFIRGYGVSDIRTKSAIDEHTIFQIGSCSKPLTAAGIGLLVQDGKIKWDTPIIERWRDFQVADPVVTKQATLRDILCHRTGVGKGESMLYYGMPSTRTEILQRLPEVQPAAPFRTEWRYSNLMYVVAGRVVEQIAGESWDAYMSKRLFQPLGMTRTHTTTKSLAQTKNVAVPHVRVKDETYPTEFADQDNIGPGASISSSISDLSQWLLMMVSEGRYHGKQILKPEGVREMVKPQILMPFVDPVHGAHVFDAYGLGLMLRDYHGRRIANHSGMAGHSLAMLGFVPEKRVGVVVLTNHRRCLFHYAVFRKALDLYCGMPEIDLDSAHKKLLADLHTRQAHALKRRDEARDPSKKPTLSLENYRGTYQGEYGLLARVEKESGGIVLRYGNFVADVTHWHDDTFRARLRQRRLADEQDWYLTFTVVKGMITKLHIDSEHDVHADFVRVAESDNESRLARGDRFAGMDAYLRAAREQWQVPGLAIAVVKDGEVVLARGYGVCELGKDRKVGPDTAFPLASSAKSFMAAAVGMLVEEGKLRWDDPVAKHLPGLELSDRYLTEHVTVRDMLCHRTGLRRADLLADGAGFDSQEIMRRLKYLEPIADLRTQYIYNNHMYTVLGEMLTRVAGQPWQQFVAERIFRPLDMKSTTATATEIPPERLALRHGRSDAGIVARPVDRGLHSTVADMAQWLKLQLAEGTFQGRRLLKPETVREMHALQFSVPIRARPKDNVYAAQFYGSGLGWFVQDYRGRKIVLHGGAWGAMVAMIPEEKLGVVILSNLDLESIAGLLMYDVFDAYLVGPDMAWNRDKWRSTWLRNEPPGHAYRPRDEAKARLEKTRTPGTKPSLPLEQYAGAFDSKLYGRLVVRHDGGRLSVTFGEFTTELSHWQDESFYVRAPTWLTFDWLLTFGVSKGSQVTDVTVKHVGWDKDEKDQLFVRGK